MTYSKLKWNAVSWEVDRRMKRRGNKIPQPRSDFIGGILFRCHKPFLFSLIKKAYEWI